MPTDFQPLAEQLRETYGPDPSDVGAIDGTEDDYGDLLNDVWDALLPDCDQDDELWQDFQKVALDSRATNWDAWLAPLEAFASIYG